MKEFRQYDKKYCDRETSHCCLSLDIYCEHCAELRKMGWQAALEWIYNYHYGEENDATAFDIINKELNT